MRAFEIEEQLRRVPFVPFRLCITDGSAFEVGHPEMIMVSRTIVALAVHKPRSRMPEGIVFCDPVHIIRIEPKRNGRTRKRSTPNR